jgi:hypothetical protein
MLAMKAVLFHEDRQKDGWTNATNLIFGVLFAVAPKNGRKIFTQ